MGREGKGREERGKAEPSVLTRSPSAQENFQAFLTLLKLSRRVVYTSIPSLLGNNGCAQIRDSLESGDAPPITYLTGRGGNTRDSLVHLDSQSFPGGPRENSKI